MQHAFLTNRNGLDRPRKTRSEIHKNSSHSWKNCHKPVGLLICQISQVPNKFHKPLASDLWLSSQTAYVVECSEQRRNNTWTEHEQNKFFYLIRNCSLIASQTMESYRENLYLNRTRTEQVILFDQKLFPDCITGACYDFYFFFRVL